MGKISKQDKILINNLFDNKITISEFEINLKILKKNGVNLEELKSKNKDILTFLDEERLMLHYNKVNYIFNSLDPNQKYQKVRPRSENRGNLIFESSETENDNNCNDKERESDITENGLGSPRRIQKSSSQPNPTLLKSFQGLIIGKRNNDGPSSLSSSPQKS